MDDLEDRSDRDWGAKGRSKEVLMLIDELSKQVEV